MKFSCEKSVLVSAISVASRTVSPKSPLTVLEGLYIRAGLSLQITGYNLETGITVNIPADIQETGECVMPCKLFFDIIRKLPEDEVTVTVADDLQVSIRCGISAFTLAAASGVDYPALPEVKEDEGVVLPQNALREMINGTIFSASENATRPIHTGCLFEVEEDCITVIAVDGYRLAVRRYRPEKPFMKTMKFVVPAAALREVEKILEDCDDEVEFSLGKRHITFTAGSATLVCRILEGEFMDWRKVMQKREGVSLVARVSTLAASIDRVSLVVTEKFKSPVKCLFGKDGAQFRTATLMGTANDSCALAGDGRDLEIAFNCRYLLDALRAVPAQEVTLNLSDNLSPLILTPTEEGRDDFSYLVLPVRMRTEN